MQLLGSGDVIDNAVGEGAPLGHADENKCRTNEQLTPKSALFRPLFSPPPPLSYDVLSLRVMCECSFSLAPLCPLSVCGGMCAESSRSERRDHMLHS